MRVSCIIPTSFRERSIKYLNRCIDSIENSADLAHMKVNIVLVTNQEKVLPRNYKLYKTIILKNDSSFSDMNNEGINYVLTKQNPEYVLFVNDDAYIEKYFFTEVKKVKKVFSLLCPLILEDDGEEIDSFGVEYFRSGYAKNCKEIGISTTLASASCLIVRGKFLRLLKKRYGFYFNPLISWYLEDVEFAIRSLGLGGKIVKNKKIIARHFGSFTSGKRSYFTLYSTYKHILYLIILTWPVGIIVKNFFSVIKVQIWTFLYSTYKHGPLLYLRSLSSTVIELPIPLKQRKLILSCYKKNFKFENIFSKYDFRTRRGIPA